MFISWAYNIYMVSTTPILDFKQRYKEHARFKTLAPRMYTNTLYTIWSRTQKSSNLEYPEYLTNGIDGLVKYHTISLTSTFLRALFKRTVQQEVGKHTL